MKHLWTRTTGLFPTRLPTGLDEFEKFTTNILTAYKIPDMPGYRQAIATMIMHLSPTTDKKSKLYFAKAVRKAQSNQIAYQVIQKIREEQEKTEGTEDNKAKLTSVEQSAQ